MLTYVTSSDSEIPDWTQLLPLGEFEGWFFSAFHSWLYPVPVSYPVHYNNK